MTDENLAVTSPNIPPANLIPNIATEAGKVKPNKTSSDLLVKVMILGIINLVIVIILIFLLGAISQKAQELKKLRTLKAKAAQADLETIQLDIAASKDKADKLTAIFPDETGLVSFTKGIDKLKQDKLVSHFSFASDDVVKDKTGFLGLPLVLEFRGTWSQIDQALKNIYQLPFFIRAINVEVKKIPGEGEVSFKYGGILYVSQNFAGN